MKNPLQLLVLLCLYLAASACDPKSNSTDTTTPPSTPEAPIAPTPPPAPETAESLVIKDGGIHGIKIGEAIASYGETLRPEVVRNGEGEFEAYLILGPHDEVLGTVYPDIDETKVGIIEISDPYLTTPEGIHISSTLGDLRAAFGDVEIHGSEIESRTTVMIDQIAYLLDIFFASYEVDESEVPDATAIRGISILPAPNEQEVLIAPLDLLQGKWQSQDDPNSYISFAGDKKSDTYTGVEGVDEAMISINDRCLNGEAAAADSGDYLNDATNDMCWYIDLLTETKLHLIYMGRGNTLSYRRVE